MRRMIVVALSASVAACGPQSPEEAPAAAADPVEISRTDTLEIALRNDGTVLLRGEEMTANELGDRLGEMDPPPTLTVRADVDAIDHGARSKATDAPMVKKT